MWKNRLAIVLALLTLVVAIILNNVEYRRPFVMFFLKRIIKALLPKIADNREIPWQKGPGEKQKSTEDLPNVILIVADDFGINDLSSYGATRGAAGTDLQTPHIDSIGRDGVKFMNAYTTGATCAPARAGLMSGRFPTRFGFQFTPMAQGIPEVLTKLSKFLWPRGEAYDSLLVKPVECEGEYPKCPENLPFNKQGLPTSEITIAKQLKKKGYYTAQIGKWNLGQSEELQPTEHGFDDALTLAGGFYLPEDHPDVVNGHRDIDPLESILRCTFQHATRFNAGESFTPKGYVTDYFTDEAVKVIENNKNRPFFLYMAHWAIHFPIQALRADYDSLSYIEDHNLRVYASMIKSIDRSTERILSSLEENGLTNNTIVIFTSDNGAAGNVGVRDSNKPYRGHKLSLFEGGTRVPFTVKWPDKIAPGTVYNPIVSHVDIFPTLSAAAGIELPSDRVMDGTDLIPHILSNGRKKTIHDTLHWRSGDAYSIIHKGWKLQKYMDPDNIFLYHLEVDFTEENNLVDERPDKVAELEREFAKHNATMPPPKWPMFLKYPVAIDYILDDDYSIQDVVFYPN